MRDPRAWSLAALAVVALFAAPACGQVISNQPWVYPGPVAAYSAPVGMMPAYGPGSYYGVPGYTAPAAWNIVAPGPAGAGPMVVQQPYVEAVPEESESGPARIADDGGMSDQSGSDDVLWDPHGRHGGHGNCGLGQALGFLAPYSEGSCCTPHWFDLHMEAVFLRRGRVSDRVDFTSLGFTLPGEQPNIVMSSEDLDLGTAPGLRVTGVLQTGPGSNLEVTYLGMTHWSDTAAYIQAPETGGLFSPFSDFGSSELGVPYAGYMEVDDADSHAISLKSQLNSLEMNYRRRWVGPTCMLQGSWLGGFRWVQVRESLEYLTRAAKYDQDMSTYVREAKADYTVSTTNNLYGFQLGGDTWLCLIPGLNIGAEGKAGIYGNDARQRTHIVATSIPEGDPLGREAAQDTDAAFVGELNFMVNYRLNPKFTLRGGYMLMWAEGLALATENFNSTPPNKFTPFPGTTSTRERVVSIRDDGSAFWHGWTIGAEYMW